ncbi:MAG: hypothetical protein BTN85_0838 [Candidatus Methanohalarchaeum thermophilum]|uniref:Uncharacterized protein n=1 Tax=Methanohalarchaeum thermophilum TaxID=1903181 RepID=A0A1Q6DVI0_METT1|nr:MAG: hypothetical protein BTN85_0838 [Candidatus Methanohalarchaeum thermophilum]
MPASCPLVGCDYTGKDNKDLVEHAKEHHIDLVEALRQEKHEKELEDLIEKAREKNPEFVEKLEKEVSE